MRPATRDKYRILIVDDERVNLETLGTLLEPEYATVVARSGEQALGRAIGVRAPDLILLDIMMPSMDGYEVCRRLKANPATADIPVIFVTAMREEQDEFKGLQTGAIDYITKPFSPAIVSARIRNHLELKRRGDLLAELSSSDGMTGIPNRRRFDQFLDGELARAVRSQSELSLILMDIDHFKQFNDTYGHLAGDDCLKRIAQFLPTTIKRATDLVARYGGEEFAAVLPATNEDDCLAIAERIRLGVMELATLREASPVANQVTMSLGITTGVPSQGCTSEVIIGAADRALYVAKEDGRNLVRAGRRFDNQAS